MTDVVVVKEKTTSVVRVTTTSGVAVITPPAAPAKIIIATPGGVTVFPDTDPHVTGAGYWVGGVLTRSAG
jgi:hypothetical protein